MSQRKALVASLVITLVLALSAIGIRAAFFDSPQAAADPENVITTVVPGTGQYDDDDGESEDSEEESQTWVDSISTNRDDDDDDDHEDNEHEEDHDDDEH